MRTILDVGLPDEVRVIDPVGYEYNLFHSAYVPHIEKRIAQGQRIGAILHEAAQGYNEAEHEIEQKKENI